MPDGVPLLADPPVMPPVTAGAPQLYVVPAGTRPLAGSAGVTVNVPPLHTVAVMLLIAAFGLTVTVTVKLFPVQLPSAGGDVGITVYVAVCDILVVLVSVPLMLVGLPLLADPSGIPPDTTGATHV